VTTRINKDTGETSLASQMDVERMALDLGIPIDVIQSQLDDDAIGYVHSDSSYLVRENAPGSQDLLDSLQYRKP